MRTCLGRTTVYANPFSDIGKLPLGLVKEGWSETENRLFRHATCNFDQTIKPKPQGVGGYAPHAADLMTSHFTRLDTASMVLARTWVT